MLPNGFQIWKNPTPTSREMIEKFRSHTKHVIPCLNDVKIVDQQSSHPLINLEWCGIECSGKYGLLLGSDNQGQHNVMLDNSAQGSANTAKKLYESLVKDPNTTAYSTEQLKGILNGNETEIKRISTMRHENIITLLGVYYQDRSGNVLPMLVMESVQCDLEHYLLHYTEITTCNEDLSILQGISSGLMYLHEIKSIIHNRVCTNSVLLTKDLVVKLSNFESVIIMDKSTDKVVFSQSSDMFLFGIILSKILSVRHSHSHTEDDESLKKLLHSLFELCTSTQLNCRPTFCDILKALKEHKRKPVQKTKIRLLDEFNKLTVEYQKVQQQHTEMIQEKERRHFQLTNSFTTVDSRSPTSLSEDYMCIQHHDRLAAARAHKKAHSGCDPVPFHEHTMIAFTKAKELAFTAFNQYLERSLFQMQTESDRVSKDDDVLAIFRLMLNTFYEKHNLAENPMESIRKKLDEAYKQHVGANEVSIPDQVKDYHVKLAEFTWTSVAKTIPMVLSMEKTQFDDEIHELKDDPEDGDHDHLLSATNINYVYPTLFVSNKLPREVAKKGKVKLV